MPKVSRSCGATDVGQLLRQVRRDQGQSIENATSAARFVGVSVSTETIRRWEQGDNLERFIVLAHYLDTLGRPIKVG